MKLRNLYSKIAFLIPMLIGLATTVAGQGVFSRFDFNFTPMTTATIGPNALSINSASVTNGQAAFMAGGCGPQFGFDLDIPNTNNIFDMASIGMRFGFRRTESRADFFVRGNTRFYMTGGALFIQYEISGAGGVNTVLGPFATGHILPTDGQFHEYAFEYQHVTGEAQVLVDGTAVWSFDGPDGRELSWNSNVNPIVGTVMDGNCSEQPILDYAEFYVPTINLPVEFVDFQVAYSNGKVDLDWITANEVNNREFRIERSFENGPFEAVGAVPATTAGQDGLFRYEYQDTPGASGVYAYRLIQVDVDGSENLSKVEEVWAEAIGRIQTISYPNPFTTMIHIEPSEGSEALEIINSQGQIVKRIDVPEDGMAAEVATDDLPAGLYTLVAKGPKKKETIKMIKK